MWGKGAEAGAKGDRGDLPKHDWRPIRHDVEVVEHHGARVEALRHARASCRLVYRTPQGRHAVFGMREHTRRVGASKIGCGRMGSDTSTPNLRAEDQPVAVVVDVAHGDAVLTRAKHAQPVPQCSHVRVRLGLRVPLPTLAARRRLGRDRFALATLRMFGKKSASRGPYTWSHVPHVDIARSL
jgi:hypothetical protein